MVTQCFLMIFWFLNNSVGVDVWVLGGFLWVNDLKTPLGLPCDAPGFLSVSQ